MRYGASSPAARPRGELCSKQLFIDLVRTAQKRRSRFEYGTSPMSSVEHIHLYEAGCPLSGLVDQLPYSQEAIRKALIRAEVALRAPIR